jgi:hypothetical protein
MFYFYPSLLAKLNNQDFSFISLPLPPQYDFGKPVASDDLLELLRIKDISILSFGLINSSTSLRKLYS